MKIRTILACSLFWAIASNAYAIKYSLPTTPGDTVISYSPDETIEVETEQNETLLDVARRYLLGQTEVVRINPDVDRWLVKKGQKIRLPNKRILPSSPHQGITLNIAEFRMYVYPPDQPGSVLSFAHGVGRQDWKTPLGQTHVERKIKDPVWNPPESIRREHAANGDPLPAVVPAGPHNPLGAYALYLALPGEYRIHGTDIDKIFGIGMQITHGCVRMYPEDIEKLYYMTPIGTPVYIVKQPIKVGWLDNNLYVEAHPDLEGEDMTQDQRYAVALDLIRKANNGELPEFDQAVLNEVLTKLDGDPRPIYERLPPLEGELHEAPIEAIPVIGKPAPVVKPKIEKKPAIKELTAGKKPQGAKTKAPLPSKLAAKKAPIDKDIGKKAVASKKASATKAAVKPAAKTKAVASKPATTVKASTSKKSGSAGGYYHGN